MQKSHKNAPITYEDRQSRRQLKKKLRQSKAMIDIVPFMT